MWLISVILVPLMKTALCQRVFCSQWWQEDQQREVAPLTSEVMKLHFRQSTLPLPIYYHFRGSETTSSHSSVHVLINTQIANVLTLAVRLEGTSKGRGCCGCAASRSCKMISAKKTGWAGVLPYEICRCSCADNARYSCSCGNAESW